MGVQFTTLRTAICASCIAVHTKSHRISWVSRCSAAIHRNPISKRSRGFYSSSIAAKTQRCNDRKINSPTHQGINIMDLLNTFLLFNVAATVAVLIGFVAMRDTVADGFSAVAAKFSGFNTAGAAGAATSMVVLASVVHLFQ
jgi:hypothetical protein